MITCYELFKTNQPKLHDIVSQDLAKSTVDIVLSNYISNKQAYDELEHYKAHQSLLGKHPIFKILEAKEEISRMNGVELAKKITTLEANIRRNEKKHNTKLVVRDKKLLDHAKQTLQNR